MRLTPDTLRATYDYLRAMPPFRRWRLPPGRAVTFKVARMDDFAECEECNGQFTLRVSERTNGHLITLLQTMAHEMGHMHAGMNHGKAFHRAMRQVAKHHGFDEKAL